MKYELAQMEITKFINNENNEKVSLNKKVISYEKSSRYISKICVVDIQNKKAYDVYNPEEVYPVLERDENFFLLPNQEIKLGIAYAIKEKVLKQNFNEKPDFLFHKTLTKRR